MTTTTYVQTCTAGSNGVVAWNVLIKNRILPDLILFMTHAWLVVPQQCSHTHTHTCNIRVSQICCTNVCKCVSVYSWKITICDRVNCLTVSYIGCSRRAIFDDNELSNIFANSIDRPRERLGRRAVWKYYWLFFFLTVISFSGYCGKKIKNTLNVNPRNVRSIVLNLDLSHKKKKKKM